jgi:UPF0271 protein
MGEGTGTDEQIMPFVSSANIACGYHAGSLDEMRKVIRMAVTNSVAIGAHPSFADRENFGRKEFSLPSAEIYRLVTEQLRTIQSLAKEEGAVLHHVKPHGALYNLSARDATVAAAIVAAVKDLEPSLILYGLSGSLSIDAALEAGLPAAREVFADRRYRADGSLVPRSDQRALIEVPAESVLQVEQILTTGTVPSIDGSAIPLSADTICIHGDSKGAVETARALAAGLQRLVIECRPVNSLNSF